MNVITIDAADRETMTEMMSKLGLDESTLSLLWLWLSCCDFAATAYTVSWVQMMQRLLVEREEALVQVAIVRMLMMTKMTCLR